ncbi:hypothetical protein D9Q81_01470, partial [Candidatus Korarchaeum cryptofilum]
MRVKVANKIFERSIPDKDFESVKERLKSVCRFEPSSATWVFDPRKALCRDPSFLKEIFGVPEDLIREEVRKYKEQLDERLNKIFESGKFAFLPCGEVREPFRIEEGLAVVEIRELRDMISREGPLVLSAIISSINGYYIEEHLNELKGLGREVVIRDSGRGLIVEADAILKDLESIASVKYYVKTIREVKVHEIPILRRSGNRIEAPYFAHHWIRRIAEKNGLSVRDEVNWPDSELKLSKNFSLYDFQEAAVGEWERSGRVGAGGSP